MQFLQFTSPVKRFYTFVLKRLIGKFLSNDLDVNQLDIQITQGIVELHDLALDCHVLNDVIEGLPFEIVLAEVDKIRINIPITDLWNSSCSLSIDGLLIKVTPLIDSHKEHLSFRGRSWLYELANSLSIDANNNNNKNSDHDTQQNIDIELYRGLHKVLSNKQFYDHNEDDDNNDIDDEDEDEDQTNPGMQLISDLVQRILYNLRIDINNTTFVITHPSPLDTNCDSVLKIQLRELTVANIPTANESGSNDRSKLMKRIRFCGLIVQLFHTSLTESIISLSCDINNESNVIIHSQADDNDNIDKCSYIDIEAPLHNQYKQSKMEITGFVRNLRAVLNPLQLTLFLDIFQTISLSSQLAAKTIEKEENIPAEKVILDFELKIHSAILILLENNHDTIPSDWYLSNDDNDDDSEDDDCGALLEASYPWIPELLIPQIGIKLSNIGIHFQQIPTHAICTVNISSIEMVEFLPIIANACKHYKPRQMMKRPILCTIYDEWTPSITLSIRNVYGERNDINMHISPAVIDLDFELFSRLNLISKAFAFIAEMDYNVLPKEDSNNSNNNIIIKTASVCVRFYVQNEENIARKENILFEFEELIATNESNSNMWNIDCKNLNVLLLYDERKHLILKSGSSYCDENNSLKIYINGNHAEEDGHDHDDDDDDSVDSKCELEEAHFRWWDDTKSSEIKFPRGDKRATTQKFELKAQHSAPTHIDVFLPEATVVCSKSQYDLLIELYMKAIDSLEKVEAQSYSPLYEAQSLNALHMQSSAIIEPLEMPSFVAEMIETQAETKTETQTQTETQTHFISSVKISIKHGRVDINEDCAKNIDKKGSAVMDPTVSSIPAQTFRLDFKSLQITHIVKQEEDEDQEEKESGKSKVSYVVLRTNDICLLEFDEVLEAFSDNVSADYLTLHNNDSSNRIRGKGYPLLFKTLENQTFGFNQSTNDTDVLHLFLSLRVKQSECDDTFLQIFTLVNLRALSHEFRLESEWSRKLAEFFSVDAMDSMDTMDAIDRDKKERRLLQNVSNVYVDAYDCCVSYNPIPTAQRLVITSEKIRISSNVVALSPMVSVRIACRDGAVYLHPDSVKTFTQCLSQLFIKKQQLRKPFLHRLPGNLLADHLDSIGFVAILDFDCIETLISQNKKITKNEVSISGGCIKVKTCKDSTASLLTIVTFLINQIIKQPTIQEVELLLPDDDEDDGANDGANDEHDLLHNTHDLLHNIQSTKFNILGNIDEHMFANNNIDIGIDSSSSDVCHHDIDGIKLITDYAPTQSNSESVSSPNREYVDLEKERDLTTPFKNSKLKLNLNDNNADGNDNTVDDQCGGWYSDKDEGVDVHYLDKKLQEKLHTLSDPNLPIKYPPPNTHIKIRDISLHWKIFGGLDFNTHKHKHKGEAQLQSPHEFLKHEYDETCMKNMHINYRSNRAVDEVMQMCLNNVQLSFYQFDAHQHIANRLVLSIQNVEVLDLIRESNFHKFLCFYRKQREYKSMVKLEMNSMRPEPNKDPDRLETDIIISLLPVRLNIDQLAVDFAIKFFSSLMHEFEEDDDEEQEEEKQEQEQEERKEETMYFEKFVFSDLVLCVDYNPRRVDFDRLRSGDYSQLVHLFPLSLVEIKLRRFEITGCNGWDACFVELAKYWALDFATHQTHKYVAGIQPVRSIVNMGSGIADLVIIPIQQYQEDGRITKGLQKGAKSAVQKITLETLDLSDGLFTTVHSFLSSLESLFHSKSTRKKRRENKGKRKRTDYLGRSTHREPHNTAQGLRQASESFTKGIIEAAHSIAFVPIEKYKKAGVHAGFKSVLKGVPSAILHPLIGTTKAVSNAIVGVRNSIDSPLNDDHD